LAKATSLIASYEKQAKITGFLVLNLLQGGEQMGFYTML